MGIILDTHILLWLMLKDERLKKPERLVIESAVSSNGGGLWISAISLWEISTLSHRGRIHLGMPCDVWLNLTLNAPGISFMEISPAIAIEAGMLPGEVHGDPADRLLIASARIHNFMLATHDTKIADYAGQGYIKLLKC